MLEKCEFRSGCANGKAGWIEDRVAVGAHDERWGGWRDDRKRREMTAWRRWMEGEKEARTPTDGLISIAERSPGVLGGL